MKTNVLKTSTSFIPANSKYPYRLIVKEGKGILNNNVLTILQVERDFNNNGTFTPISSGWELSDVNFSKSLCIDFASNWCVNIPDDIWEELNN